MNRLVLIDGNAVLHRAYHALPPLTTPDGTVVNAVFGFTSVIIKLFSDFQPTHMAVAFDRPKPTFRKKLYADYQSKRPEMETALVSQIGLVHDMVEAFGIPIFEEDGFEADDVIGTIVKKCQMLKTKCPIDQTIIVTGDRDILQLVEDDRVLVYMPTKGISEGKIYGTKDVVERMGVAPKQIPDFKALAGDSSDNYPGVAGIGPKTAVNLLTAFGTLEKVYSGIEKQEKKLTAFSHGVIEKLVNGKKDAYLSQDLATIRTNAPIDFKPKKAEIKTLNTKKVEEQMMKFHFHTLLSRVTGKPRGEEKSELSVNGAKKQKKEEKNTEQLSLV